MSTENTLKDQQTIDQILEKHLIPIHAIDPVIRTFILAYISCRHVGDAAKAAGINKTHANKLLNKRDIYNAIVAVGNESARKFGYDASEVMARFNEVVQVDPAECYNPDGTYKQWHEIPPAVRRAIKSVKVVETWEKDLNGVDVQSGRIIDIVFWDKIKAGELLGKQEGLFKETVKHEHTHELGAKAASVLLGSVDKAESKLRQVLDEPVLIEARKV